jgi:hypothetical protein
VLIYNNIIIKIIVVGAGKKNRLMGLGKPGK